MSVDFLKKLGMLVVFCLIQALILNRIKLFGCATPLLYVHFILMFPSDYPRWGTILWGFVMGVAADMFANTPGVASASLTFIAFIQQPFLGLMVRDNRDEDIKPTMASMGFWRYFTYSLPLILLYCLIFFALEDFSFYDWKQYLLNIAGSSLFTMLFILVIENTKGK